MSLNLPVTILKLMAYFWYLAMEDCYIRKLDTIRLERMIACDAEYYISLREEMEQFTEQRKHLFIKLHFKNWGLQSVMCYVKDQHKQSGNQPS